jgi:nucleoside-diphosphate-sugar epimerase
MRDTILVVGGAGYVGSVLVQELLARGYAVRILDRLYFGDQGLRESRDRAQLIVDDMRTVPEEAFDDVQVVINVGGLSNDPTAEFQPTANREMNTVASVELAKRARDYGVSRYIFSSSCSIYDRGVEDDSADVILDEDSPVDPRAAYSSSKFEAERELLPLADEKFCVVLLRKGTVFGFSPRMRYDLVLNTFIKDALSKGYMSLHFGGEMWRPLVDVRDAARAYIALVQADRQAVNAQVFNLVYRNFRISELALRAQFALNELGISCDVRTDYGYKGVRNYRVSGQKLAAAINFRPTISVEESVQTMVSEIRSHGYTDFENPRYYNIAWMRMLDEAQRVISVTGSVFEAPTRAPRIARQLG